MGDRSARAPPAAPLVLESSSRRSVLETAATSDCGGGQGPDVYHPGRGRPPATGDEHERSGLVRGPVGPGAVALVG
ncbi:MAG TPA: hypothetical protein VFN50_12815, partial [Acidimicrobiales bacterium]|nr:hypothetical protein [Acidimicrobiales bacterium]